jgi:hypothetical protein
MSQAHKTKKANRKWLAFMNLRSGWRIRTSDLRVMSGGRSKTITLETIYLWQPQGFTSLSLCNTWYTWSTGFSKFCVPGYVPFFASPFDATSGHLPQRINWNHGKAISIPPPTLPWHALAPCRRPNDFAGSRDLNKSPDISYSSGWPHSIGSCRGGGGNPMTMTVRSIMPWRSDQRVFPGDAASPLH